MIQIFTCHWRFLRTFISFSNSTIFLYIFQVCSQCRKVVSNCVNVLETCTRNILASRVYDSVPPATKKQQTALKNKLLEGESSFASHCRSFESQIRELNQQFNTVKEKVSELHKDISALRKAQTPPLMARYELLTRECLHLDQSLER